MQRNKIQAPFKALEMKDLSSNTFKLFKTLYKTPVAFDSFWSNELLS